MNDGGLRADDAPSLPEIHFEQADAKRQKRLAQMSVENRDTTGARWRRVETVDRHCAHQTIGTQSTRQIHAVSTHETLILQNRPLGLSVEKRLM